MARLDDEDLRNRLDVARATLVSTRARLSKLLAGSRPEEIREAEAAVQQAQFDHFAKQPVLIFADPMDNYEFPADPALQGKMDKRLVCNASPVGHTVFQPY